MLPVGCSPSIPFANVGCECYPFPLLPPTQSFQYPYTSVCVCTSCVCVRPASPKYLPSSSAEDWVLEAAFRGQLPSDILAHKLPDSLKRAEREI